MADRLEHMLNLGRSTAAWLRAAGISTPDELRRVGAEEAWRRIQQSGQPGLSRNALYALDGAIHDLRWNQLPRSRRLELDAAWSRLNEEDP